MQLDRFAQRLIRHKVRRLIGKHRFTRSDREDLEQELWLHLLERLKAPGTEIAHRKAFIATILNRHIVDLLRRRRAAKRFTKNQQSLNKLVQDEDGCWVQFSATIPSNQGHSPLGSTQRDELADMELRLDVATVLASLPTDLRDLCERLKENSVTAVARQLGMSRRCVRDAIARIRQHFVAGGF